MMMCCKQLSRYFAVRVIASLLLIRCVLLFHRRVIVVRINDSEWTYNFLRCRRNFDVEAAALHTFHTGQYFPTVGDVRLHAAEVLGVFVTFGPHLMLVHSNSDPTVHPASQKKTQHTYSFQNLRQILTNFRNSFTSKLIRVCATNWSLEIPPHLKRVATLPCETLVIKNWPD